MNVIRCVLATLKLLAILQLARQHCYIMKPLSFSTWDTPNYGLVMKMHLNNNSLSSVTYVRKDVPIPLWHIMIMQHPTKKRASVAEPPKLLYNSTVRTCDFWKYITRVNAWKNAAKLMISGGGSNMSLACPLKTGMYTMNIIQVPPDMAILKFMYQPNTVYAIHGTVYSLNPKDGNTKQPVCHYEVNATIIKTC